jgi:hypothetical protein
MSTYLSRSLYHLISASRLQTHPGNQVPQKGGIRVDANGKRGPNFLPNSFRGPAPRPEAAADGSDGTRRLSPPLQNT